ncbi:hypothetical protein GW17_00043896, partial [Ensete ventricosum]
MPPSNCEATARLSEMSAVRESQDDAEDENFTRRRSRRSLLVAFSSSEAMRKKRETSMTSHLCREEKPQRLLIHTGRRKLDFFSPCREKKMR